MVMITLVIVIKVDFENVQTNENVIFWNRDQIHSLPLAVLTIVYFVP